MGKRYYCDYCDRSFQDNMHNRKKHLYGVQHHRAKKAWFDNFRDAVAILADEQLKKPCRKFLQTGQCVFGANCRFSHMTEREMEHLQRLAAGSNSRGPKESGRKGVPSDPVVDDWLARREKRRAAQDSGCALNEEEDEKPLGLDLPPHFRSIPDLPPSLLPPPPSGWTTTVQCQWG
ncbi:zinc finger matrin-type protein 5 [Clupea harengus]|uniref:Zinc finger matrin-type protein 5 n=1 Tax=Clupea harengus TaxID=7950 RepID=A0A6P3WDV6_CLUHA|nr:zinc finger matrin-type protein 5 [Clupea harengus]